MKIPSAIAVAVMASLAGFSTAAFAQDAQAVRDYLSGQRFLVTYRHGGPAYGTYFFLTVNLCRSGSYFTLGQSRKQSVLESHGEQVHDWQDQGRWDVTESAGRIAVRYISTTGQVSLYPIYIGPNGQIATNNGMTVVRKGPAQCP